MCSLASSRKALFDQNFGNAGGGENVREVGR